MLTSYIGYRLTRGIIALAFISTLTVLASARHKVTSEIAIENCPRFGLLLVRAEVDGKPAVLIVDTGSTVSVISSKLATLSDRHLDDVMMPRSGSGLVGRGVYAQVTIKVGPIVWGERRIVVMDMREVSKSLDREVDGLLGLDFFGELASFAVDIKNHKLIVNPGAGSLKASSSKASVNRAGIEVEP